MRGDAGGQEDIRANGAVFADNSVTAHDRRTRVDGYTVLDSGVAFLAAEQLASRERFRHQAHTLVHFDVIADDRGFADNGASAVVHKKMTADLGTRVQIHPGARVPTPS